MIGMRARVYITIAGAIVAVLGLVPASAWAKTVPATVHKHSVSMAPLTPTYNGHSTYCGTWYPNPGNPQIGQVQQKEALTEPDGAQASIKVGYTSSVISDGQLVPDGWYFYANLYGGYAYDQIALLWKSDGGYGAGYNTVNNWYQCGDDGSGDNWATLWPGTNDTWTAGVPACEVWAFNFVYHQVGVTDQSNWLFGQEQNNGTGFNPCLGQ